jgi:hypothetical protein
MSKPIFDVAQIVSDETITSVGVQKRVLQHINYLSERIRTLEASMEEIEMLISMENIHPIMESQSKESTTTSTGGENRC